MQYFEGCVAKILGGNDAREGLLLFGLDSYSKQAGDEGDLPRNVPLGHSLHLPFAHHVHHLKSLQCSPRCLGGEEAHPRLRQPFDEAMVLFDQVIQVFDLPKLN